MVARHVHEEEEQEEHVGDLEHGANRLLHELMHGIPLLSQLEEAEETAHTKGLDAAALDVDSSDELRRCHEELD